MPADTIRTVTRNTLRFVTAAAVCVAVAGTVVARDQSSSSGEGSGGMNASSSRTAGDTAPAMLTLTGIARDFKGSDASGGHVDFQRQPTAGFGHYVGQAKDTLDDDKKPVFNSTGYKVDKQATDAQGRNIMPMIPGEDSSRNPRSDDARRTTARVASTQGGALTTPANFAQWFRDVPGVNVTIPVTINLKKQANSSVYTFDDRTDDTFKSRSGFFPINGEGFGNSGTWGRNYHFTFELATKFTYRRGTGQIFTFTGDDDVYVYIAGRKVIDLGGVHSAVSQTVDLDTCLWLTDGEEYELKLFFCERHYSESNMRIDTTLNLRNADLPVVNGLFD